MVLVSGRLRAARRVGEQPTPTIAKMVITVNKVLPTGAGARQSTAAIDDGIYQMEVKPISFGTGYMTNGDHMQYIRARPMNEWHFGRDAWGPAHFRRGPAIRKARNLGTQKSIACWRDIG
jgi:hypothetical protein